MSTSVSFDPASLSAAAFQTRRRGRPPKYKTEEERILAKKISEQKARAKYYQKKKDQEALEEVDRQKKVEHMDMLAKKLAERLALRRKEKEESEEESEEDSDDSN